MQNLTQLEFVSWKLTWIIWQILIRAFENLKNFILMGCFWPKYIIFELKKVQSSYVWLYWKLMPNLKESWLVLSKMTRRIWQSFFHKLKNRDFILGNKMAELYKNKKSKQPNQSDALWKLYFTLEINKYHN